MITEDTKRAAKRFANRAIDYARPVSGGRGKVLKPGMDPKAAVQKAKHEDPEGFKAFITIDRAENPQAHETPVAAAATPHVPPVKSETTPDTFESIVMRRVKEGVALGIAIRGASNHPGLLDDYFRRIREGQADALAGVWI